MDLICVSGNTGAGKSTLLRGLAADLAERGFAVARIDESSLHHRLLQHLFDEPERWGLTLQLNFLIQRTAAILERVSDGTQVLVMERSQSEDPIFFERLVRLGCIDAGLLDSYHALRKALTEACPEPRGFVFVNASPEVCMARLNAAILDGSRPVELTGDALVEYVAELDAAYRAWRVALPSDVGVFDLDVASVTGPSVSDVTACLSAIEGWLT